MSLGSFFKKLGVDIEKIVVPVAEIAEPEVDVLFPEVALLYNGAVNEAVKLIAVGKVAAAAGGTGTVTLSNVASAVEPLLTSYLATLGLPAPTDAHINSFAQSILSSIQTLVQIEQGSVSQNPGGSIANGILAAQPVAATVVTQPIAAAVTQPVVETVTQTVTAKPVVSASIPG
jgi:hypothetical protein